MRNLHRHPVAHRAQPRSQRGVALFVGLVFLVILSLVAIIAMKGTLLEMRMVNNVASHERAFEVSETLRGVPVALFDQHVFNRGWPANDGAEGFAFDGTLPPTDFVYTLSKDMMDKASSGLRRDGSGPVNLYAIQFQTGEDAYHPEKWLANDPDMTVSICSTGDGCTATGSADLYIRPDGTVIEAGSGGAQVTGYRGPGTSSAGGGASAFFEILSVGTSGSGRAVTMAQYRQAIRN